ncbi:MAG TPA: DUF3090 domain-containing protein [Actinomycetes bacterium]|jgi:uncharacterized repeat protein (TIGR03847 family)|nr:DUF3090 domain-containing protein [Actinomycetes bacterium]
MPQRDLDPVTRLTADAVGVPGQRTFLIQAASGTDQVTLLVEKEQVRVLAERVIAWLPELAADRPEDPEEVREAEAAELGLSEPLEPDFRVGQLALTYDPERDRVVMLATELVADEIEREGEAADSGPEPLEVRLWVTRPQLRVMARHGAQVVRQGRPPCPLCGNPLDPSGHVCPAQNGHRPTLA